MKKRATIMDVAKLAGVDYSTVSLALRGDPRVRESTRVKVEDCAKQLGYRPNRLASSLSGGSSKVIGVMFTEMSQFFSEPLKMLHSVFDKAGYTLTVHFSAWSQDRERQGLLHFCESQVDGIIWAPCEWKGKDFVETHEILKRHNTPYVMLGLADEASPIDCNQVGGLLEEPIRVAISYLKSLEHQRIGVATATQMPGRVGDMHRMRLEAIKSVFHSLGLDLNPNDILETQDHDHGGLEIALNLSKRARDDRPSAILACDDMMTRGLAKGLSVLGLSIPDDLSLIGFDVIQDDTIEDLLLTSVSLEVGEATLQAGSILRDVVCAGGTSKPSHRVEVVDPRLIVGSSCAPCPLTSA